MGFAANLKTALFGLALGFTVRRGLAQEDDGAVAMPAGEVIVLSDDTFEAVTSGNEIVLVNFYADWCRFSQMLKPIFAETARALADMDNVRLGSVNCESEDTVVSREKYHVSKYPTIKVYRRGIALKSEYRGQRSPSAVKAYIEELMKEAMTPVESMAEVDEHLQKDHRAVIGKFPDRSHANFAAYEKVATRLRDECHFMFWGDADPEGSLFFKSTREELVYDGDKGDEEAIYEWAREHCNPIVRQITFENGEELTEEGLPFLIMFYDPDKHETVDEFTAVVKERFNKERGSINFITADGSKFSHPLRHLGKTKADLPVLAFDTFKHMHLFRKFENIHRPGLLEDFVADLHSGKLHHDFHHPPAEKPIYDKDSPAELTDASKSAEAAPASGEAPAEGDAATEAPADGGEPAAAQEDAKEDGEGGAEESATGEAAEGAAEDAKEEPPKPTEEKTIKEKLVEAEKQKRPDVPIEPKKPDGHIDEHDDAMEEGDYKPVAVKSVLKHLMPSQSRYSFKHNRDEF